MGIFNAKKYFREYTHGTFRTDTVVIFSEHTAFGGEGLRYADPGEDTPHQLNYRLRHS